MTSSVQEFYEHNTKRFLRYGGGNAIGAIHRKLWAPSVRTREDALLFINHWIHNQLAEYRSASEGETRYLDLGCGVGGTSLFLAESTDANLHGLTLSPLQAKNAAHRASELQLQDRCSFFVADFETLPTTRVYDAAFAIEAFAHCSDPLRFFKQVSECLRPGAVLIIVDDMLAEQRDRYPAGSVRNTWLQRFKTGWRINTLLEPASILALAEKAGLTFKSSHNFTDYVRITRGILRWVLTGFARLPVSGTYWQSLSGGIALQVCIAEGWVQYTGLVFEQV